MAQYTDEELEREIQAKGKTAPRVTAQQIDDKIIAVHHHRFPNTTLTVCAIELENGYLVVGHSASASPENFDREIGEKLAYDHARSQIWQLEGYLLREKQFQGVDSL